MWFDGRQLTELDTVPHLEGFMERGGEYLFPEKELFLTLVE
jgi:hypothetical protein